MRSSIFLPVFAVAVWAQSDTAAETSAVEALSSASSSASSLVSEASSIAVCRELRISPTNNLFWNGG